MSNDWFKTEIIIENFLVEPLSALLYELSPAGFEVYDLDNKTVIAFYTPIVNNDDIAKQEQDLRSKINAVLKKISQADFGLPINKQVNTQDIKTPIEVLISLVSSQTWEDNYKKFFKPIQIGRIFIKPTWEASRVPTDMILIELDPGLAFGTGLHPTTKGSLCYLQEFVKNGEIVLDIGTGSGILAIATAKLGASKVIAIDNDSIAIDVAKENAQINSVFELIDFKVADISELSKLRADIVVANITAPVIINLLNVIKEKIIDLKYFIAAGITLTQKEEVIKVALAKGFKILDAKEEKEWVALAMENV